MRTHITTTIDLSGPFFTKDPALVLSQNVELMMAAIAKEGEEDVRAQMQAGESTRAPLSFGGRVAERLRGRVTSLQHNPWHRTAIVSPSREGLSPKDAIALYAAASRIESKSHPFRTTTNRLRRAKAVNTAELTRGLE